MVGNERRGNESARVYKDLKRQLRAYELPPGKPINVRVVAEKLNVSVSPAQEACQQLVGEGWAIGADKHHFLAWHPDENIRVGLYETTEGLLISALHLVKVDGPAGEKRRIAVQRVYEDLSRHGFSDEAVALRTRELFGEIVAATDNEGAQELMRTTSDSLHYLRMLENRYLDDVPGDLTRICELTLSSREVDLIKKIREYHRERCDWLPNLIHLLADD